jgi:hypothetical protein
MRPTEIISEHFRFLSIALIMFIFASAQQQPLLIADVLSLTHVSHHFYMNAFYSSLFDKSTIFQRSFESHTFLERYIDPPP